MSPAKPPSRQDWARAFSLQALADLRTRDLLALNNAEVFARLHCLQMAAEKLCKAYLVQENGVEAMQYSHCILQKQLPRVIENVLQRTTQWPAEKRRAEIRSLKQLIQEIEFLSPSCDHQGSRPDNSEYPWRDPSGVVHVPCEHTFTINDADRRLINLMKLMRRAAQDVQDSTNQ